MQGFRIGGQAETAAERGEGWCGPWSTASRLIEQREQARMEREDQIREGGGTAQPLHTWKPRREPTTSPRRRGPKSAVPSLQDMCVAFLVRHVDAVASFGVLGGGVQHAIAAGLCRVRKLDDTALELLTQPDASVTELVLPDCSHVTEEALINALTRLTEEPAQPPASPSEEAPSGLLDLNPDEEASDDEAAARPPLVSRLPRLSLVDLGFCGRPFTAKAAVLLHRLDSLQTLRLQGCFRLSNSSLSSLMTHRGPGLSELAISGNSQLSAAGISAIGTHCTSLRVLRLEDCDQLPPDALLPLRSLKRLHTLSLAGLFLLNDATLVAIADACHESLIGLSIRGCSLVTPEAVVTMARTCSKIEDLDLSGVELMTDAAAIALSEGLPALERLQLKACVQLSDEAIAAIASGCPDLVRLSLNKIPALSDASLAALTARCSAKLSSLDISWCRGVSDHGIGALVDACEDLEELTIWGCTQLTDRFYEGHSRDGLRIVGRGPDRVRAK